MNRLTFEGNFCDIAQCTEIPCRHANNCTQKQAWGRLRAYEDSGLTPEQCCAWAENMKPKFLKMRDCREFWRRIYAADRSVMAFERRAGISHMPLLAATEDHKFRAATARKIAAAMGAELEEIFVELR